MKSREGRRSTRSKKEGGKEEGTRGSSRSDIRYTYLYMVYMYKHPLYKSLSIVQAIIMSGDMYTRVYMGIGGKGFHTPVVTLGTFTGDINFTGAPGARVHDCIT